MVRTARHAFDAGEIAPEGMAQAHPSRKQIRAGVCLPQRSGPYRGLCHEGAYRATASGGGVSLRRELPHAARFLRPTTIGSPIRARSEAAESLPQMRRPGGDCRRGQAAPFRIIALPVVWASSGLGIARQLHLP
jgi:hypothetical protein